MKSKKKIMLAFGTRPEAIKMAPIYHCLKDNSNDFEVLVCVTAQHREMLDHALNTFDIKPDIDLNLMTPGQDLFDVSAGVLLGMRNVLNDHKPDILLVHGDTTTSLFSGIAGFYQNILVGHVEAGLRTHNLHAPFPEEFNRQALGRVVHWHFAPTKLSRENLLREGVDKNQIAITGNTVIDALYLVLERIELNPHKRHSIQDYLSEKLSFKWMSDKFILITGHRRENFGDGFLNICNAIKILAKRFPMIRFVYPVHMNPKVQVTVRDILGNLSNVHLIQPLDYEPFVYLLKYCYFVMTDSGGIQEEAPSLAKPVLVMRDLTERPEGVEFGTVKLVGANQDMIISNVAELLEDEGIYKSMSMAHNPYGDGKASNRIIDILKGA
ncbi:non-hydrolyzing UDP-N-acetylglucosamine 2-epimerase [Polynucleobacter sp. AP-Ainpum-60-G11]|uniref:non-hydrolyzing UDP-N-acetylglucosamine 2-epimerase n=1 Tax=Polynucleobacter sp. AP-Ainpum-60-G11 TaxID=2576926 RepID=UPI001BFD1A9C|nr:UDP-N-acetylglucosamine 2-epimerase (non-hydrolyzing) [Polynucleobacter sp. AP-Ainpum-60-G11]QWE27029.1 UDP-N-acetylglucosamine 2-epimerase (non-hydrolyzing) [Polynucleobacter sp. AP-Ainpum-60-G11]